MTDSPPRSSIPIPQTWRVPLIVLGVALALRVAFIAWGPGARGNDLAFDDERWYWRLAESLRDGHGLVGEFGHRAERLPLYPGFLSLFVEMDQGVNAARVAQAVLAAFAATATCLLARRVAAPVLLAGLIVACDPTLVGSCSLLLTESLYVAAVALLWWVAWPLRRRVGCSMARWVGVWWVACLAIYLRESSLVLVAALLLYVLLTRRDRRVVIGVLGVSLGIGGALYPWAARNDRVLGAWCWLTTRGGISLYDGVRPGATGASDLEEIKQAPEVADLSEVAWNRHFRRAAWRAIAEEPSRVLGLAPRKLVRTWSPVLHASEFQSPWIRLIFAAWYIPLYLLAVAGVWSYRRQWGTCAGLLLPAICISLLHGVFVGSVRYRLGALPTIAVLASIGAMDLKQRMSRGRCPTEEPG